MDGIPDECETDSDGDGIPDDCDECPDDPYDNCVCPDDLVSDGCIAEVTAIFSDCYHALICSSKDLSNIVVDFAPQGFGSEDFKYDDLDVGQSWTITEDEVVLGVWIKSGCNSSDDCPGCGEYVANPFADDCTSSFQLESAPNGDREELNQESQDRAHGSVHVYPNPTQNLLYIDLSAFSGLEGQVLLTDTAGQRLWQKTYQQLPGERVTLELENYPAGQYFIIAQIKGQREVFRQEITVSKM